MKISRNELTIGTRQYTKYSPPLGYDNTAGQVTSLASLLLVIGVIVGVPVLFAVEVLADKELSNFIIYPLLLLFILTVALNQKQIFSNKAHKIFYLYFFTLLFATILAGTIFSSVYTQIITLGMCFIWATVFISIYHIVKTPGQYRIAMRLLDIVGIAIALSVFLSYIGPEYFGFSFGEIIYAPGIRAFGPFGDQVGFVLSYFMLRSFVYNRWLSVAIYLAAILFTGTRGAVLSVTVGIVWLIFQLLTDKEDYSKVRYRAIPILILVIAGAFFFLSSPYGETTLSRFEDLLLGEDTLLQRRTAIEYGVRVYLDYPILGVGYLGFNRLSDAYNFYQYLSFGSDAQRGMYTAQNQYVQTATDAGTPGLLLLLIFLLTLLNEHTRGRSLANRLDKLDLLCSSAWIIAMALGNQAAVWILPATVTSYFFFLMMGLSLSLIRMQDQRLLPISSTQINKILGTKPDVQ